MGFLDKAVYRGCGGTSRCANDDHRSHRPAPWLNASFTLAALSFVAISRNSSSLRIASRKRAFFDPKGLGGRSDCIIREARLRCYSCAKIREGSGLQMNNPSANSHAGVRQALVLSGGGARAAYQVGCLRHIAQVIPEYRPKILTGVSAGAINAVHLAAYRGEWLEAVERLRSLWLSLETNKVYHADLRHVLRRVLHWGLRVLSGGRMGRGDVRGMVDSSPLQQFLRANLPQQNGQIAGVHENLQEAVIEAVAIITTNYASGRSEAWVQSSNDELWQQGQLLSQPAEISLPHILASAALPMFFPAVSLNGQWHGDGGIRLSAPLSPAMHLGADRILAVSPRAQNAADDSASTAGYPSPAQIAGVLLNAVFLDLLDFDALQMQRINDLLAQLPQQQWGKYRPVDVMVLRPKEDLGELARAHELELPKAFRFFQQGLGDRREPSADALSMVMFEPEYLRLLMHLGEQDAAARSDEIRAFLLAAKTHGESEHV